MQITIQKRLESDLIKEANPLQIDWGDLEAVFSSCTS